MICWTLGITEHHTAVDNVLALINLALLTGHVGRWGSGINPLRGQNNVQGGGDMGALPDRLPGFQHVENDEVRARFERGVGRDASRRRRGWHLSGMFEAMERGELTRALRDRREPGAVGGRSAPRRGTCSTASTAWSCRTCCLTGTAAIADVVLPAAAAAFESEGTVTSSERRVQRVRRTKAPAGECARRPRDHLRAGRGSMGARLGRARRRAGLGRAAHAVAGARRHELRAARGAATACSGRATTTRIPARRSSTAGCGSGRSSGRGRRSRVVEHGRRSTRSTTSSRSA